MRKYAFVLKFFQNKKYHGGGEKVFFKLIEYLASRGNMIDVYCTQIVRTNDSMFFYNQPFYGDVHIIFKSVLCDVKYSYWGDIVTYTKRESKDDDPIYTFKTNKTALQNLEWAKLVGLK